MATSVGPTVWGHGVSALPPAGAATRPGSFFYGWLLLALAFLFLGLAYTVWYGYAVFFVALLAEFSWSRGITAGAVMLLMVVHGLTCPVAGLLIARVGIRRTYLIGALTTGVALLACSQVREPWQLYVAFGLLGGVGIALFGMVPNVTLLQRWFSRQLGLAVGIAMAGIGVGFGVYIPLVQLLISAIGWRGAWIVMAAVAVGIVTPLTLWLVREWPSDIGQVPDGAPHAAEAHASDVLREVDRQWTARAWSLSAAVREPRFWLAVASGAGSNVSPQIAFIHGPAVMVDAGYDPLAAALVIGASGFVIIGGTILWGWLSDRAGRELSFSLGLGCQIVSMLLLAIASRTVHVPLAASLAVFIGLGYAVLTPLVAAVAADMFRGPRFAAIYGVFIAASASVGGLTAWLAGLVFDRTGNYLPIISAAIVVNVLAAVGMWLAAPRRVRLAPGRVRRRPPTAPDG